MRIAIIGAGLTGCTAARLLADRGHLVTMFEEQPRIGGLCATGRLGTVDYCLYGSHVVHTDDAAVKDFFLRFAQFNGYMHFKATFVNGKYLPYPVSYETIDQLPQKDRILCELSGRPRDLDTGNFETCLISMMGRTLYEMFIRNYTMKLWGVDPRLLDADWAPRRIEIRADNSASYFGSEWQGLPVGGFSPMFQRMIGGIPVQLNCAIASLQEAVELSADLVISTIPLDRLLSYRHGRLVYRGIRQEVTLEDSWPDDRFGDINFPNDQAYIRKTNFTLCSKASRAQGLVMGYEFPVAEGTMYPVLNAANKARLRLYLDDLVKQERIVSIGRLGLFKYYDMDEIVAWCIRNCEALESFAGQTEVWRREFYQGA
ncbi:MAG: FAD-dependent oxidoreductase [Spirochaetia bacterium]|jgi:UDP-galactopyranose mutase